jgi:hypothetical protein
MIQHYQQAVRLGWDWWRCGVPNKGHIVRFICNAKAHPSELKGMLLNVD